MIWWTARQLKSRDVSTRIEAARKLGESGDRKAVPPLLEALSDAEGSVRTAVAEALQRIPHPGAADPLVRALGEGGGKTQEEYGALTEAIARQGNSAVRPLLAVLGSDAKEPRVWAARALGRIGYPEAVVPLGKALDDRRSEMRREAALALGQIGDQRAFDALSRAASHRDADTRRAALEALGAIGDQRAIPLLSAALQEADEKTQLQAVTSLGRLGTVAAALALRPALESGKRTLREAGRAALNSVTATPATPAERAALALIRGDFEAALREGQDAVQPLIDSLSSHDGSHRRAAAEALGRLAPGRAIESLLKLLGDADTAVAAAAAEALGAAGPAALPGLTKALGSPDVAEQKNAALAIAGAGTPRAVPMLIDVVRRNRRAAQDYTEPLEAARAAARALEAIFSRASAEVDVKDLENMAELPDGILERFSADGASRFEEVRVECANLRELARRLLERKQRRE